MSESNNPYQSPRSDDTANEPVMAQAADRHAVMCHVTEDDLLAWATHFMQRSPMIKRQRVVRGLVYAAMMLSLFLLIGLMLDAWLLASVAVCPAAVLMGAYVLFLPLLQRRSVVKFNRRLYRQGNVRNLVGDVRFEITPEEIRRETNYGHAVNYWQGIEGIELGEEHLFIVIVPSSAYVVPYRDFNDEQHRTNFLAACQRWFEQGQERELPLPSWTRQS